MSFKSLQVFFSFWGAFLWFGGSLLLLLLICSCFFPFPNFSFAFLGFEVRGLCCCCCCCSALLSAAFSLYYCLCFTIGGLSQIYLFLFFWVFVLFLSWCLLSLALLLLFFPCLLVRYLHLPSFIFFFLLGICILSFIFWFVHFSSLSSSILTLKPDGNREKQEACLESSNKN